MAGRWRKLAVGGSFCLLLGCNGFGKRDPFASQSGYRPAPEVQEPVTKGPLKPDTLVAFGNASLDAADPKYVRSAAEREKLLGESSKNFQLALEKQPKNSQAIAGLAKVYYYQGDKDKSIEMYRRVLQVEPRSAPMWFELSWVQAKLGRDYNAAVDSLSEASRLEPDNTVYRRWLGRTLALAGRSDEGVAVLSRNMPETEARLDVAEVLHLMGRRDAARQQVERVLQIDPDHVAAREILSELAGSPLPAAPSGIQPAKFEVPVPPAPSAEVPKAIPQVNRQNAPAEPLPLNGQTMAEPWKSARQ